VSITKADIARVAYEADRAQFPVNPARGWDELSENERDAAEFDAVQIMAGMGGGNRSAVFRSVCETLLPIGNRVYQEELLERVTMGREPVEFREPEGQSGAE
jgi:hypothetical protein